MSTEQDELLVASEEKGYFEVWQMNENRLTHYQITRLPVESVWSVTSLQNSDIALATSSGTVYIYSRDPTRKAHESTLDTFDAQFAEILNREQEFQKNHNDNVVTIKVSLDDGPAKLDLTYEKGTDPQLAAEKFILVGGFVFEIIVCCCCVLDKQFADHVSVRNC